MNKQLLVSLALAISIAGDIAAMETNAQKAATRTVLTTVTHEIRHASTITELQRARQQLVNVKNQLPLAAFQYFMTTADTREQQLTQSAHPNSYNN
ncbi:MAG: hypothetical protein WCE21_00500 [Candidatus Babeliales bacterium]